MGKSDVPTLPKQKLPDRSVAEDRLLPVTVEFVKNLILSCLPSRMFMMVYRHATRGKTLISTWRSILQNLQPLPIAIRPVSVYKGLSHISTTTSYWTRWPRDHLCSISVLVSSSIYMVRSSSSDCQNELFSNFDFSNLVFVKLTSSITELGLKHLR